ncbi:alpha/beta hydrolase [Bacillus toyonensis]|uniref:alpha/beta fold hydrolase n=1 Tax=Bacillus toyonensis TaxID=155322 RepID=UPI000BF75AF0|nr:alpha/beta hydrolase [Bacillus toyonensis]PFX64764.1 alpha/beta hydrolase [Bacillus toyonensis]PHB82251.1 alpha/beta hydrolase [Bacillus toyonensis]
MKDHIITLQDGRKLAYIEYGKTNGLPVMLFHGTPGSRIWSLTDDMVAKRFGIRLISIDRPGYGLSDPKRNRTVLDWAEDVNELSDQLKLQTFSIIGVSGGGAYAAACAYQIPERLQSVQMVSSATPFENEKPPASMCRENRIAFFISKRLPLLLKWVYRTQKKQMEKNPEKYIQGLKKGNTHLCKWDQQFIQTDEDIKLAMIHMKEALRNSVDEAVAEPALLAKYWGFNFQDISIPIHIWHGTADTLSSIEEIKKVASATPHVTTHYMKDAGHFLTDDPNIWESILQTIIQDTK